MNVLKHLTSLLDGVITVADDLFLSIPRRVSSLPTASAANRGAMGRVEGASGVADEMYVSRKSAANTYAWTALSLSGHTHTHTHSLTVAQFTNSANVTASNTGTVTASCSSGVIVGGGCTMSGAATTIRRTDPSGSSSWVCTITNGTASTQTMTTTAICLTATTSA
jgi:hypothetical protein